MNEVCRNVAAEKIKEMPVEQIIKLLIFMAGMDAAGRFQSTPPADRPA